MTFSASTFRVFAHVPALAAGSPDRAIAGYTTNDTAATVEGADYFGPMAKHLPLGSQIFVSGDLDGTPFQKQYVVSAVDVDGESVTITPQDNLTFTSQHVLQYNLALTDGTYWVGTAPIAGTIDKIYSVANDQVDTNNAICTFRIDTDAITDGVITVAAAGAAGDKDSATPSGANTVAAGDAISVVVSNTPGGSATAMITILISPT